MVQALEEEVLGGRRVGRQESAARLEAMVVGWPALGELKRCAPRDSAAHRWSQALSALVAGVRAVLDGALLAERARRPGLAVCEEVNLVVMVMAGATLYEDVSWLLQGGLRAHAGVWRMGTDRVREAEDRLALVVGRPAVFGGGEPPAWAQPVDEQGAPRPFPLAVLLFGAALRSGWPWGLALRLFAGLKAGWVCGGGHGFVPDRGRELPPPGRGLAGQWLVGKLSSLTDPGAVVTVYFDFSAVVFVECSRPVFAPRLGAPAPYGRRPSLFLPPYVRLPQDAAGRLVLPRFTVTSVVERRHVWAKRIPNMDGVVRALVSGKLCYPRIDWRVVPSFKPNHKSWEQFEVKEMLGRKLAVWLYQGALEWIHPLLPRPVIIEPKGAVPKKGPDKYRDVSDSREGNKSLADWGVRYHTWKELADALTPYAIVWGHDISDGYHLAVLSGCTGELVWGWGVIGVRMVYPEDPDFEVEVGEDGSLSGNREPQEQLQFGWRLHVGCWPWNCCHTCDKAHSGMEFDGCCCRWAVAHFGQKTAGSPLNCVVLCLLRHGAMRAPAAGERRGASKRSLLGVAWVDDFAFYRWVRPHPPCAGLAGGCPVCQVGLTEAEALDVFWMELCESLGVPLNLIKRQRCGQSVEYAGFVFDTLRGLMLIQDEKREKLLRCALELGQARVATRREIDRVNGRVLHYSACVRHLRVLATELARLAGPVVEEAYDRSEPVSDALRSLTGEIVAVVERYSGAGVPLWPPVASTAYASFLRGEAGPEFFALTWDASPLGWAALLRWWEEASGCRALRDRLLVGTWPDGEDVSAQPYRECLAAPLALEAAARVLDLRGKIGLLRNDAEAAIAALRKGSTQSEPMQRSALRASRLCSELDVDLLLWHVPGMQLVEEGVDGASRGGGFFGEDANLESVLGPAVSDALWERIRGAAAAAGVAITVDAFASESNRRAERYWSRFGEPGCEAVDALSVADWGKSRCPSCGGWHREVLYVFPPSSLIRQSVKKAAADAAVCVMVVPVATTASHWPALVRCSILGGPLAPDGYVRVRSPGVHLRHVTSYDPRELAVFVCDFAALGRRANAGLPPPCAGAFARRGRPLCGSAEDAADRRRLRERLLAERRASVTGAAWQS